MSNFYHSKSFSIAYYSISVGFGVVFIMLKLTGHIDWSWWLVTIPFWALPAFMVFLYILYGFFLWIAKNQVQSGYSSRKQLCYKTNKPCACSGLCREAY